MASLISKTGSSSAVTSTSSVQPTCTVPTQSSVSNPIVASVAASALTNVALPPAPNPVSADFQAAANLQSIQKVSLKIDALVDLGKPKEAPHIVLKETVNNNASLRIAAQKGNLEECEALLKKGADPFSTNDGYNAMHLAAYAGKSEIIRMLSVHKQLLESKIKLDYTPLLLAASQGHLEACEVLLNVGANPLAINGNSLSAMHVAVRSGRAAVVQLFLVHKQLIDLRTKEGVTPFILAAQKGHLEICGALLKGGANPLAIAEDGWNAMHFAAKAEKTEIVKILLVYKQLIDSRTKKGFTPLMIAAEHGSLKTFEILLEAGADPLAMTERGWSAMHLAVWNGKIEIFQLLLAHKQLIDLKTKNGSTPILLAAEKGHLEICEALIKCGADPLATDEDGWSAMLLAVKFEKVEMVKILLGHKKLIDSKIKDGITPFLIGTARGNLEICEILLKAGADPLATTKEGYNAIHLAVISGNIEIMRLLSVHKQLIDVNPGELGTPLMLAAEKGDLNNCELLLKCGANPLALDRDGWNALHYASKFGKAEIVRLLSSNKQLLDSKTKNGGTPLMIASDEGHQEVCEVLLKCNANPFAVDEANWNAMHLAADAGKMEMIKILLAYKGLIDSKTKQGTTPLMIAAQKGHLETCEVLLKANANLIETNEFGENVMHFAAKAGKTNVIQLLSTCKQLVDSRTIIARFPILFPGQKGHQELCDIYSRSGIFPLPTYDYRWNAMYLATEELVDVVRSLLVFQRPMESKDGRGDTPLIIAAANGHLETCEILLKSGADPLAVNRYNWNSMHSAAESGNVEILRMFLVHKQLIDSKIKSGHTPLTIAISKGHLEACQALLKAGANPQATQEDGFNALHLAAQEGNAEIARILSVHKELLESVSEFGHTPLMIAAQEGSLETCEVLLKAGANPLVKDAKGFNAMQLAESAGKAEVVKMLSEYNKKLDSKS